MSTKKQKRPAETNGHTPAKAAYRPPHPGESRGPIAIAKIRPAPGNPPGRAEDVADILESVRTHGVLQDLLVRPIGKDPCFKDDGYGWTGVDYFEVIAGHRRLEAAKRAGLTKLVCKVWPVDDDTAADLRLVENVQRRDLKPSEKASLYLERRKSGRTDEQIAAAVSEPLSAVRDTLRLARCPAWFLSAVDDGTVGLSVAAIAARVPGDKDRARACACVLFGHVDLAEVDDIHLEQLDDANETSLVAGGEPLTHRDARELVQSLQVQLKGAPFSRKSLDLLPAAGSCDACPKRSGNAAKEDEEYAGVRADTCLDPECYSRKVEAHLGIERLKFRRKWKLADDADVNPDGAAMRPGTLVPAKGWVEWDGPITTSELNDDNAFAEKRFADQTVTEVVLAYPIVTGCQQPRLVFDDQHKPHILVRTSEARKTLVAAGFMKKPEPKAKAPSDEGVRTIVTGQPGFYSREIGPKSLGPKSHEVASRSMLIAARVLGEYGEEQFAALAELPDACAAGPIATAVRLITHAMAYEVLVRGEDDHCAVIALRFPGITGRMIARKAEGDRLSEIAAWTAPQCLAFLLQLSTATEIGPDGPNTDTADELLDFAEIDWDQCTEQARRELSGPAVEAPAPPIAEAKPAPAVKREPPKGKITHVVLPGGGPATIIAHPDAPLDALTSTRPTYLRHIDGFPLRVADKLDALGVMSLEDLAKHDPKGRDVRLQPYDALRSVLGPSDDIYPAGDAIIDHHAPPVPASQQWVDGPLTGESIDGLADPKDLDRASIIGTYDGPAFTNPCTVTPVRLGETLHVVTAKIKSSKGLTWYALPLFDAQEFAKRHPKILKRCDARRQRVAGLQIDATDGYLGVRVIVKDSRAGKVEKDEYVLGATREQRKLIQPKKGK